MGTIFFYVISAILAILIARDANKIGKNKWLWAVGVFFIPILSVVYLILYCRSLPIDNNTDENKNVKINERRSIIFRLFLILIAIGLVFILLSFAIKSHNSDNIQIDLLVFGIVSGLCGAIGAIFTYDNNPQGNL